MGERQAYFLFIVLGVNRLTTRSLSQGLTGQWPLVLGFFPLLSMISWGPIWNYQWSEDHCPIKPWLRLPVVSLFALGTINEVCLYFSHCKQPGLLIASNSWVTRSKSGHKVTKAEVAATEPEDEWDVKMEFGTQLGVSKMVPPHIYSHNHIYILHGS